MVRSARTLLLVSLALLQSLCGISPARSFVLCICTDGGVVLEAHDEACRCCAVDADRAVDPCCDESDEPALGHEDPSCTCTRFAIQGEDASAPRATTDLPGGAVVIQLTPPWLTPAPNISRDPRGPLDLDPDPHDPLRALRTIVLRH